jgi:hypothetical protein
MKKLSVYLLLPLLPVMLLAFSGPAAFGQGKDTGVPEGFFRHKPPLSEREIPVYQEYIKLLADDTFEKSFLDTKVGKDFKIKPDRLKYIVLKMTIIVILDVAKDDPKVIQTLTNAYGPDALPTDEERALLKPYVKKFALQLNNQKSDDVKPIPYLYYLFKL